MAVRSKQLLQTVRGQVFPKDLKLENIEYAMDYEPKGSDRILLTYPKCGTYWTSSIVQTILNQGNAIDIISGNRGSGLRIEYHGPSAVELGATLDRDVVYFQTHHNFTNFAYNPLAKYLMVIRNPKDVCVSSYYYFQKREGNTQATLDRYVKYFLRGKECGFGDYFEAVRSYWEHRLDGNCTLVTYEEMVANPRDSIVRIASFLGTKYVHRLYDRCDGQGSTDEILLDRVLRVTSFEAMKGTNTEKAYHFRKGVSGDWRALMSRDASDLIDQRVRDEWLGTGLDVLWERDMKW